MPRSNYSGTTDSDGNPLTQVYDPNTGTSIPVTAGTVATDSNHNNQKSAPLQVQLAAGTNNAAIDAQGAQLVSDGGKSNAAVAAGAPGAGVIKNAPGRLCRIVVTTLGTAAMTIYDNASAASGTALFVIPASAAAGTIYNIQGSAALGIYAGGATNTPAITIYYS